MGGRQKITAGYACGAATALAPTGERRNGYVVWRCTCACGREFLADSRTLSRGAALDCGCGAAHNAGGKSLVGQRFGRLTVTSFAGKRGGRNLWECACDCGGTTVASQSLLKAGRTRSCGCLRSEQAAVNAGRVGGSSTAMARRSVEGASVSASNSSGATGVYLNRRTGKWAAQITFRNKTHYLGSFADKADAIAARRRAEAVFEEYLRRVGEGQGRGRAAALKAPEPPTQRELL